jgi:hypothetical protein
MWYFGTESSSFDIDLIIFTWVHYTNTEKIHNFNKFFTGIYFFA